jgi:DNA-binding NtrC family response regulator
VRTLREVDPRLPLILFAYESSEKLAIAAIKAGVSDYIKSPADETAIAAVVSQWLRGTTAAAIHAASEPMIVGPSEAMVQVRVHVHRVAASDTTVLVTGETGTGKELVAQLLHGSSPRRGRSFVSINCAAIPDSLLESELFGYERGAFTGAQTGHEGHLRAADGGTLLLDEIGDMSPLAQAKILRALDAREIYRLGSTKRLPLDVRVIAATNQDLSRLVDEGKFRKDLYYRLNVVRVRLPPLRERPEDVPVLIQYFVEALNTRYRREVEGFTDEALQRLRAHDWPGNVRELRNMLEQSYAELPNTPVRFLETPAALRERVLDAQAPPHDERNRLLDALTRSNWNKSRAADSLHWSRMTLYRKLSKYSLHTPK